MDPETWSKKIGKAWVYFSATMRTKYPELCWCEGDWTMEATGVRYLMIP